MMVESIATSPLESINAIRIGPRSDLSPTGLGPTGLGPTWEGVAATAAEHSPGPGKEWMPILSLPGGSHQVPGARCVRARVVPACQDGRHARTDPQRLWPAVQHAAPA